MKALTLAVALTCASLGLASPPGKPAKCKLPPSKDKLSSAKKVKYYLAKLKDQSCTGTYGDDYTWYTAAEELGQLGEAAIPGLVEKLNSKDPYELKLALYALMMASQTESVKEKTDGEYVKLTVSLAEEYNEENRRIALAWWAKHGDKFKN